MNENTKKRAANYTNDEKILLFNIISDYKHIVENKKTDGVTWQEKDRAWNKITDTFNTAAPNLIPRNKESLKKFYENKKKELRKKIANGRIETLKTGGGETNTSVDSTDNLALSLINEKTVTGFINPYDGDSLNLNNNFENNSVNKQNISNATGDEAETIEENQLDNLDWGDYKISHLRTPLHKKLSATISSTKTKNQEETNQWIKRRRPETSVLPSSQLSKHYTDIALVKHELISLQLENLKKDTVLRRQREEEEFIIRKRILEIDLEIKEETLKKMRQNV